MKLLSHYKRKTNGSKVLLLGAWEQRFMLFSSCSYVWEKIDRQAATFSLTIKFSKFHVLDAPCIYSHGEIVRKNNK